MTQERQLGADPRRPALLVIATRCIDHIHRRSGTAVVDGGPAFFLKGALDRFFKQHGQVLDVTWLSPAVPNEVHIWPEESRGFGISRDRVSEESFAQAVTSTSAVNVLVSTSTENDFDLGLLAAHRGSLGRIFLDAQGFTRTNHVRKIFEVPQWLVDAPLATIKLSEDELPFVDHERLVHSGQGWVVFTRGASGAVLYAYRQRWEIPPQLVWSDDVEFRGCGDTLLGHFASLVLTDIDCVSALRQAQREVSTMLMESQNG